MQSYYYFLLFFYYIYYLLFIEILKNVLHSFRFVNFEDINGKISQIIGSIELFKNRNRIFVLLTFFLHIPQICLPKIFF